MAVKPIRLFGDPVLTTPAAEVTTFDKELRKLVKDLTETMLDAPGAGLAAPQLGVSLRVFTYDVDDEIGHLINPVLDLSDEMQEGDEGCLSVPDLAFNTRRSMRVVAKGMNMHGEPVILEGSELHGPLHPARDGPPRRHHVRRPSRRRDAQGGHEGHPRGRVVRPAGAAGQALAALDQLALALGVRLVFAGTPEVALPSLSALIASQHEVVAVVTRPDAPAGRGRSLQASPVADLAAEHGIEVLKPEKPRDPDFLGRLAEIAPDCCPVVAYGALVPRAALDIPRIGWVNLHFSLLPAWRGAAPVQHAVWHGDDVTGASTFLLEEGLDTGPVYGVVTETVRPTDTSGDLLGRLAVSGAGLLVATMDGLEAGALVGATQPADGISLAPKITVEDARVDWSQPAIRVDRQVRACTPAPGAWTTYLGERFKLGPVSLLADDTSLAPGEVAVDKNRVRVGTTTHAVVLGEVRAQGKKAMAAADWARGTRPEPGVRLGADGAA